MRSLVATVLLFLFSLVIAHDTVITLIADEQSHQERMQVTASHDMLYVQCHQTDLGQLHAMFHFVALTPTNVPVFSSFRQGKTFLPYPIQHTLYYIEASYKPPIA